MEISLDDRVMLLRELFSGRQDVFARLWEKGSAKGYSPEYEYDTYRYVLHRKNGGTFANFREKVFMPLTDEKIRLHIQGKVQLGIYPLLRDNTSRFLVADFDKQSWESESKAFYNICKKYGIEAWIERSRSGQGAHVWIFFATAWPAQKSRTLFGKLLTMAQHGSVLSRQGSFDRLFPSQDFHSGAGLGNLIALPLNGLSLKRGCTAFLNPETMNPYDDQWELLRKIDPVPLIVLEGVMNDLSTDQDMLADGSNKTSGMTNTPMLIQLKRVITLNRGEVPLTVINFIKDLTYINNPRFAILRKQGKSTHGVERYFQYAVETADKIVLPGGMTGSLIRFCRKQGIPHRFIDDRKKLPAITFNFRGELYPSQRDALAKMESKEMGVLVAPPGTGKTVMALKLIAMRQQPALIIVHRKSLVDQWVERIEAFLGIPRALQGRISKGRYKTGKPIMVATIQSLQKLLIGRDREKLQEAFGLVLMDECHHVTSDSWREVLALVAGYYRYGLTATPYRSDNNGSAIALQLGDVIATLDPSTNRRPDPVVLIRNTRFVMPFDPSVDEFELLATALTNDAARNSMVVKDVISVLRKGSRVLILTHRVQHVKILAHYLQSAGEVLTVTGEDTRAHRDMIHDRLRNMDYQVLITTGQYLGEGIDLPGVHTLFLVFPFSFRGMLVQYLGRVQRDGSMPVVYDYRDVGVPYLDRMFLRRNAWYRKFKHQLGLFDDPVEEPVKPVNTVKQIIQKAVILWEDLIFRYGEVGFTLSLSPETGSMAFEIEHDIIRPEFSVLKPYLKRVFRKKGIRVEVQAEFRDWQVISQSAFSPDLERIDREMIGVMRLNYVKQKWVRYHPEDTPSTTPVSAMTAEPALLYDDAGELLDELLSEKEYRHGPQLRYLARRHDLTLTRIFFVLSPFSFVFLITGRDTCHLILETLDTDEATYCWHEQKSEEGLRRLLSRTGKDLTIIRNHGRQYWLAQEPEDFSRIIHDYTDIKKGFIIWRDQLETMVGG